MSNISDAIPTFNVMDLSSDLTPVLGGNLDGADKEAKRVKMLDTGDLINVIGSAGGGTQSIDLTLGNIATVTVDTSTTTFTFDNPMPSGTETSMVVYVTNGGSQTTVWPTGVVMPTLTTAGTDWLAFQTIDAGTNWLLIGYKLDI